MRSLIAATLFIASLPFFCSAEQRMETDASTQLSTWTLSDQGFEIKFVQQLPDLVRAFFLGRGFSKVNANKIGLSCSFQIVATNLLSTDTGGRVSVNLADWKINTQDGTQGIKLKEQWATEWNNSDTNSASKVAFRWATFPSQQTFDPTGDYGWGMATMGLPPGALFDIMVTWTRNGQLRKYEIKDMRCPGDR